MMKDRDGLGPHVLEDTAHSSADRLGEVRSLVRRRGAPGRERARVEDRA